MIKIENLSTSEVVLKFKGKAGPYSKRVRSNAVMKINDQEFKEMIRPMPAILEALKISKYNIYADSRVVEIENPTNQRIAITFTRSEQDIYQKTLQAKATIRLKPEEFAFVKHLDPRLIIVNDEENQVYFQAKDTIKETPTDIVPVVVEEVLVEAVREKFGLDQEKFMKDVKQYERKDRPND